MKNKLLPNSALPALSVDAPQIAPILWLPSPDELALLQYVVNHTGAARRAFALLDGADLSNPSAQMLFDAAKAVGVELLTPDTLAAECRTRSDQNASAREAQALADAAEIALNDLATLPRSARECGPECEKIARKIAAQAPKRFDFATLCDVLKRPDPTFLIDRLLTVGGTSLLTAKHASFKSFFALDMALCVATGRAFHGLEVKRGAVVYIAAEGATGLKKRAAAWLEHHGATTPENFLILDTPFQISNVADRAGFVACIAALNPALIVLDTLARCAVGLDENNAGDMGTFADALGALARETGAHVLTVHHNNKNGDYRGSSALPAAVDTHLALERHRESDAVTLTSEKQKDAEESRPLTFEKIEVALPDTSGLGHSLVFGLVETAAASRFSMSAMEQKVFGALESIATDSGATSPQWKATAESLGVSSGAFYMAVKRLISPVDARGLGLVAVVSGEHGKRGALYAPTLQNTPNEVLE